MGQYVALALSSGVSADFRAPSLSIASRVVDALALPRWVPAFAGMAGAAWIPAFAGMTRIGHARPLVSRGRPRRGVKCCAERCARPLATISSRGTRRQTACLDFGAVLGDTVRSSPFSFDSPSRAPLAL